MSRNQLRISLALAILFIACGAMFIAGCCSNDQRSTTRTAAAPSTQPVLLATGDKGGAQLWSENCMRCHYLRQPTEFNAAEWETIVHHMRLRAGLTGQEQRAITEFLKSASH